MIDCPDGQMRDLLPEYAHGVLGAEDAERVAGHVAGCEACRAELALIAQVRGAQALDVPRIDVAAIVRALPAAPRARRMVRSPARRWVAGHAWQFAAAAGVVLVVGLGVVMRRGPEATTARLADSSQVRAAATPPPAAARVEDGITFGGGLSDLSLDDLQSLLGQMDSIRTLPSKDPESITPVIAMNDGGKTL